MSVFRIRFSKLAFGFLALLSLMVLGCDGADSQHDSDGNVAVPELKEGWREFDSEQIMIARRSGSNLYEGVLWGIELIDDQWQVTFDSVLCTFGRNGLAEPGKKMEGDGKTPSGVFPIGLPFGYEDDLGINRNFIELSDHHYWISDTSSQFYNKLVDYYPGGVYAEKMKRDDHLYKYGIVIEYNTENTIKGKGSAIFIHVKRREGAPTAGCIAISERNIKNLIRWQKPEKKTLIIIGNVDYELEDAVVEDFDLN